jgi:hypothetical protein
MSIIPSNVAQHSNDAKKALSDFTAMTPAQLSNLLDNIS